jgi:glyoxylase-like metal-dependent hydrolase (beta-lactamase superfamily II)/rhodanese-related sulfurtransferase
MMLAPLVVPLVDEGLGNSSYVVDIGDGRALVVDASVDLRFVRTATTRVGLKVTYAADTHLHADFLSGSRQLSTTDGAKVLASAVGDRQFPHTGLEDGQQVDLGGLGLTALVTPGHTTEHVSLLLSDSERPLGVFTGGSLLVGAAARTDLVDPDRTVELARAQYRSLQRLMSLPDEVEVWPTHGAGSFCSAPPGAERTSTIGRERATNPLLQAVGEAEFVQRLLGSMGTFPAYFRRLPEINRRGPRLYDAPPLPLALTAPQVGVLRESGAQVVDVRPVPDYAAGHLTGAVSIPLRAAFATWLGWVVSPDRPVVIVRATDQDPAEIAWQSAKVGYDNLVGELTSVPDVWVAAGLAVSTIALLPPDEIADQSVLDIRQDAEFNTGHLPGAAHVELGDLADRVTDLRGGPVVVMCGHGERAMTGASLLERAGATGVAVLDGGPDDWSAAHGVALETGS